MNSDLALLLAALALVLFGLLAGEGVMDFLAEKGWLLKITERLGLDIKEEEKDALFERRNG